MAIKKLGEKLSNTLHEAADTVKSKVADAEMPDLKKLGEKAAEQAKSVFQKKSADKSADSGNGAFVVPDTIPVRNAVKVIYYFMAADGEIFHGEEEKFDAIGRELMPEFDTSKELLVTECRNAMESEIDPEDHYDVIQDCVEGALLSAGEAGGDVISPKLLVWNLLTVAYSDENYNDTERRLLKYIVRKMDIDKSAFLEMESSILTLMDIEQELTWIKTTDRPYLKIETVVSELVHRKNTIFDSVKDLIVL